MFISTDQCFLIIIVSTNQFLKFDKSLLLVISYFVFHPCKVLCDICAHSNKY